MILSLYFNHFRDICIFSCIVLKICKLPINISGYPDIKSIINSLSFTVTKQRAEEINCTSLNRIIL